MIIFGGIHEITKELNDLLIFDFNNNKWLKLFDNEILSPAVNNNNFGGLSDG